jgi:hypothetical protein
VRANADLSQKASSSLGDEAFKGLDLGDGVVSREFPPVNLDATFVSDSGDVWVTLPDLSDQK